MKLISFPCAICGRKFMRDAERNSQKWCSIDCRFKSKIAFAGEQDCWLWTGTKMKNGYPVINIQGRVTLAHRLSYAIYKGGLEERLHVCHKCDTPLCVNPAHLFLGTAKENINDMAQKGRHGLAKLGPKKAAQVKALLRQGVCQRDIAKKFGVSPSAINMIVKGLTYSHIH